MKTSDWRIMQVIPQYANRWRLCSMDQTYLTAAPVSYSLDDLAELSDAKLLMQVLS